jgi:hypothetical protein
MTRSRAQAGIDEDDGAAGEAPAIRVHLDELLAQRGMTLTELSARMDVTIVN